MGLVVLFVILLYLAMLVAAPALAYRFAPHLGWASKRKSVAAVAFAVVFLPMFWDWIPTAWAFSYYCEKYAGLTVYKSLEQWRRENPRAEENLIPQSPPLQVGPVGNGYLLLNQRFRWETKSTERFLTIVQRDEFLTDSHTGSELARFVNFATKRSVRSIQSLRDVKLWLNFNSCEPSDISNESQQSAKLRSDGEEFNKLRMALQDIGRAK